MPRLPAGFTIEPESGALVPLQARTCSQLEFMSRLSLTEQVALAAVRLNPATPLDVRATLEVLRETRDNTANKRINLDDPRTAMGAQVVLDVLASLPLNTPGRIDPADVPARHAAWLADFPQPGESAL